MDGLLVDGLLASLYSSITEYCERVIVYLFTLSFVLFVLRKGRVIRWYVSYLPKEWYSQTENVIFSHEYFK